MELCKHILKHSGDTDTVTSTHLYSLPPSADTHFHVMAHGQKNKSLTSHQQSATGHRKNAKSMTSQAVPLDENIISAAVPPRPKPRPRPHPTGRKSANIGDEKGESKADAALALISLQNCTNIVLNSPPTPGHCYFGPTRDSPTLYENEDIYEKEKDVGQSARDPDCEVGEEESEVEIDKLGDNDSDLDDSCKPKLMKCFRS